MSKHASPGLGPNNNVWIAAKWDRIQHKNPQRPGGPRTSGPHDPPNHGSGFDLSNHFKHKKRHK
jgi:hypothetical protein